MIAILLFIIALVSLVLGQYLIFVIALGLGAILSSMGKARKTQDRIRQDIAVHLRKEPIGATVAQRDAKETDTTLQTMLVVIGVLFAIGLLFALTR